MDTVKLRDAAKANDCFNELRGVAISAFRKALRRKPRVSDLNAGSLGRFQNWLLVHHTDGTRHKYLCSIRALWRDLARLGVAEPTPSMAREIEHEARRVARESRASRKVTERCADMTLEDFAIWYALQRDVSDDYRKQLRLTARRFSEDSGCYRLCDLTVDRLNEYLASLRCRCYSDRTIQGRRISLIVLWNAAADCDLCPYPRSRRVMKPRVRDRLVRTWTVEQVRHLIEAAGELDGEYSHGISRAAYWVSYLHAAWDTGLRGCDLRRLDRVNIRPDGNFDIVQSKTGRIVRRAVRRSTLQVIDSTFPPERALCWPLWASLAQWRLAAKHLIADAGLQGSLRCLRSAAGTAVERMRPGEGHHFLGNGRQIFQERYLDDSQIGAPRILPPDLFE